MKEPVEIWLKARGSAYETPIFLPREGPVSVHLKAPGDYYLVVRDRGNAEDHLRWFDLHKLVRDYPDVTITFEGGRVRIQKTGTISTQVAVPIEKMATKKVYKCVSVVKADGSIAYQYVLVEEAYKYTVYEYKTVAHAYTYEVEEFIVKASAKSKNGPIDLEKYRVIEKGKGK